MSGGRSAVGNFAPQHGPLSGSGRGAMRTPFGRVTVVGKIGDVVYQLTNDILATNGSGASILAQAVGGDVSISLTLAPPDLALNPDQSNVWVNSTAVAEGGIVALPFLPTALKITFTEAATLYLAAV